MKSASNKFAFALAVFFIGTLLSGRSFGACGDANYKMVPQSWNGQFGSFLPVSSGASNDPIVGMWHVTFTAQDNESGPPDGTPIDNSIVVWHDDGTEIMNSSRPAQDGNFCLGIWAITGKFTY
jgi:hypothetical protein